MIAKYYGKSHTQDYIYGMMGPYAPNGYVYADNAVKYYKPSSGLNKPCSSVEYSVYWGNGVGEIDSNRPFVSCISGHARVCRGYEDNGFLTSYLYINDPKPPYIIGHANWEAFGSEVHRIYVES